MELKLSHDIKVKVGENKKYKTTLHLPLWQLRQGRSGQITIRRRPSMEASSPAHNPVGLVLEAGTAKSGYTAILIGDIFG